MSEERLRDELLQGRRLLLWIGAGCSFSSGVPLDSLEEGGLAHTLASIHYGSPGNARDELGEHFRLADLASRLGKRRVRDLIRQQDWQRLPPTRGYLAIAALVAEGFNIDIVTTNFDPLIERAFDQAAPGVTYAVVSSPASVASLADGDQVIVKLHGCPYADGDPENLMLRDEDLENPPGWVTTFVNGRLQEREFVYAGFSGNVPYVWRSVQQTVEDLGRLNESFGVDMLPVDGVFDGRSALGRFYETCGVTRQNYSADGSDAFFANVADLVVRSILLEACEQAVATASRRGPSEAGAVAEDIRGMPFDAACRFGRRLVFLFPNRTANLRGASITSALAWMFTLAGCGVLDPTSFRPVLAAPYYPGPTSSSPGPVVMFDGCSQDAPLCYSYLQRSYEEGEIQDEFQLRGCARWFALILNCVGVLQPEGLDIVPREPDAVTRGYSPMVCLDENSLAGCVDSLEDIFS